MNAAAQRWEEFDLLLDRVLDGLESADDARRLNQLLRADPDAWRRFVRYMGLHGRLTWGKGMAANDECRMMNDESSKDVPATAPSPSIHHSSFIIHHSEILGSPIFCYAVAGLLLAVGILAARAWIVPAKAVNPAAGALTVQVVKNVRRTTESGGQVGRITEMFACEWVNPHMGDGDWLAVKLGSKYILTAGRMEITYRSGARVVLQGPAVYEVDDRNGGFLRRGTAIVLCRVTAERKTGEKEKGPQAVSSVSTPKNLPFFSIHTPHAGRLNAFLLQDVDLVVVVDSNGDVCTRAISPSEISWGPSVAGKNFAMPGNRRVTVGISRGSNREPVFAIVHGAPPSKKKPSAPAETTVYSGDSTKKAPTGGAAKGRNHVPDS